MDGRGKVFLGKKKETNANPTRPVCLLHIVYFFVFRVDFMTLLVRKTLGKATVTRFVTGVSIVLLVQVPPADAVVVPTVDVPSETVTVLFASAVPESTGFAMLDGDAGVDEAITGATGAVVSTSMIKPLDEGDALPAASVDVARSVN